MNKESSIHESSTHRTLKGDLHHSRDYIHDHPIVTSLGASAVLALGFAAGHVSTEITQNATCIPGDETATVLSGEGLWNIATRIDSSADPRDTIQHIRSVNPEIAQPGYVLRAGETISVPICGDDIAQK